MEKTNKEKWFEQHTRALRLLMFEGRLPVFLSYAFGAASNNISDSAVEAVTKYMDKEEQNIKGDLELLEEAIILRLKDEGIVSVEIYRHKGAYEISGRHKHDGRTVFPEGDRVAFLSISEAPEAIEQFVSRWREQNTPGNLSQIRFRNKQFAEYGCN